MATCRISNNPTDLKVMTHSNYIQGVACFGLDTIITTSKDRCVKVWKKRKGSTLNYSCRIIKKVAQDRMDQGSSQKSETGN